MLQVDMTLKLQVKTKRPDTNRPETNSERSNCILQRKLGML